MRDALIALSDDDREIVLLNAWDGLDTHALGTFFAISTNAAACVFRGRNAGFASVERPGSALKVFQ